MKIKDIPNDMKNGFTIVELLIVIIVIGILAGLALNTIGTSQARARDTQRITDVQALHKSLEFFYQDNGYYPGSTDITTIGMPGLNSLSLLDPNGDIIGGADSDYSYSSEECDGSDQNCNHYQLISEMEQRDDYLVEGLHSGL